MCNCADKPSNPIPPICPRCSHSMAKHVPRGEGYFCNLCRCRRQFPPK